MKLREIVERLDTPWATYVPSDDLAKACGIYDYIEAELADHGFGMRPIAEWCCTDTWVGMHVIYYKNEPVAITDQRARKSDVTVEWISVDAAKMVRDILLSLVKPDEPNNGFDIVDLDKEVGEPEFQLEYSSQIIQMEAVYNGQAVPIVKTFHGYDPKTWHTAVIEYNGKNISVNLKELKFPIKLKEKTG